MIIEKIELGNIRSYEDVTIIFPKGSILLSGDIGSGKSSIFHAIEFALFGLSRGDIEGQALLRNFAKRGFVKLYFSVGNTHVSIQRNLVRTKNAITQETGTLCLNDVCEELSATELKTRILSILQYPKISPKTTALLFKYTVYCGQEQMKEILGVQSEQRLEIMRSIFGIDMYKRIRENVLLYARKLREDIAEQKGLSFGLEKLQEQSSAIDIKIQNATSIQQKLHITMDDLMKRKSEAQNRYIQFQKQQDDFEKNLIRIQNFDQTKKTIQKNLSDISEKIKLSHDQIQIFEKLQVPLKPSLDDHKIIQQELEKYVSILATQTQEQKTFQLQYDELQQTLGEIEEELNSLRKQHDELVIIQKKTLQDQKTMNEKKNQFDSTITQQIDSLQEKLVRINQQIDSLLESKNQVTQNDTCPTCHQDITTEYSRHVCQIVDEKLTQLQTAQKQLENHYEDAKKNKIFQESLQIQIQELEVQVAVSQQKISQKNQIVEQILKLNQKKEVLQKKIAEIHKNQNTIQAQSTQDKIELFRKKLNQIQVEQKVYDEYVQKKNKISEQKKNLQVLLTQKESYEKELQLLDEQLAKLQSQPPFEKEKLIRAQKQVDEIQNNVTQIIAQIHEQKTQIVLLSEQKNDLTKQIIQKQNAKKEYEEKQSHSQWINQLFIPLMQTIEQTVMVTVLDEFQKIFSYWFDILIEDENITVRLDSAFTPIIMQNGCEMFASHLSGGERTSVALAYRLAVNTVINKIHATIQTKDILLLDEPTDGFSHEQLERLRLVFDTLSVSQLLVVSHEPKIETFVSNVIHIKKEQHKSVAVNLHNR